MRHLTPPAARRYTRDTSASALVAKVLPPCLALVAFLVVPAVCHAAGSAYIANDGSGNVSQYSVEPDGEMKPMSTATVAAGAGPVDITVSSNGRNAYVTNAGSETVSQYSIEPNGELKPMSTATVRTGREPCQVVVSPNGKNAYVTDFGSEEVSQYNVEPNGELKAMSTATVRARSEPYGLAVSPNGKSAFVANFISHDVSQYKVEPNGELKAMSTATVEAGTEASLLVVSPNGKNAYVTNYGAEDVSQYSIEPSGELKPESVPTVRTKSRPEGIAMSPEGDGVYVSNAGSHDVSQYDVEPNGELKAMSTATVEAGTEPCQVVVSPDGKSAYVTDFGSEEVSQYSVEPNGELKAKTTATVKAGVAPYGIAVAPATPSVQTGAASGVGTSTATLNGTVGAGSSSTVYFQYGTTTAYASSTPAQTIAASAGESQITATLSGLSPETTYHFRIVGEDPVGTSYGSDRTFTTSPKALVAAAPSPGGAGVVTSPSGQSVAPIVSQLRVRSRCVQPGRLGTAPSSGSTGLAFSYVLSESADVLYVIERRDGSPGRRRCGPAPGHTPGRYTEVGSLTGSGLAGSNDVSLATTASANAAHHPSRSSRVQRSQSGLRAGRHRVTLIQLIRGGQLTPGTYVLLVQATNAAGQRSNEATVKFFVVAG